VGDDDTRGAAKVLRWSLVVLIGGFSASGLFVSLMFTHLSTQIEGIAKQTTAIIQGHMAEDYHRGVPTYVDRKFDTLRRETSSQLGSMNIELRAMTAEVGRLNGVLLSRYGVDGIGRGE